MTPTPDRTSRNEHPGGGPPHGPDDRLFPDVGEVDIVRIARGVISRWRIIGLIAFLVTSAALVPIILYMKPSFVSRATISKVERTKLYDEPWAPPPGPRLNTDTLLGLVEGRRVMERGMELLGEDINLREMRLRIGVEWPRNQDVFYITAGHETPDRARKYCESATDAFIEIQHARFRDELAKSEKLLKERLGDARAAVDERQNTALEFRRKHHVMATNSAPEELIRQLVDLETRIAELKALGTADENAAGAIRQGGDDPSEGGADAPTPAIDEGTPETGLGTKPVAAKWKITRSSWWKQVRSTRRELEQLQERYTESHPRVKALTKELRRLTAMERRGEVEPPRRKTDGTAAGGSGRWTADEMEMSSRHRLAQAKSLEKAAADLRARIDTYTSRQRQLELLDADTKAAKERYDDVREQMDKLEALKSIRAPLFDVVEAPDLPDQSESRGRRVAAAGAMFLGMLLGVGLALIREVRDTSVRAPLDIERQGLPVLATVSVGGSAVGSRTRREAIRLVAQALRREVTLAEESRCVLVTSAGADVGKTELTRDVGKELVRWGEGVVRVDANLREANGGSGKPDGQLDDYLLGREPSFKPQPDDWGIPTVTSGNLGEEAPDLLSRKGLRSALLLSAAMGAEHEDERGPGLELASAGFRLAGASNNLCMIDGPAFLPSVDAELLADAADSVLLVVEKGRCRIEEVQEMVARLSDARRPVLGAVLTEREQRRSLLARIMLGPKSFLLALMLTALTLGGCVSQNLATDTLEESNTQLARDQAGTWEIVGSEQVDLTQYHRRPTDPYIIGEGDVLEIAVIGYPEVSRGGVLVRPDGRIGVPLVGDVRVAGLRPEEASSLLTERLAEFLKAPTATVLVQQAQNSSVLVLGMVGTPGRLPLLGPTRLLEVLAMAGGLQYRDDEGVDPVAADLKRATLMRGREIVPVDFGRLLMAGDTDQNVYVKPNDVIHLPPMREQDVLILGEVQGPTVLRYGPELTLLRALARAGGVTVEAETGELRIIRGSLARPRIYHVDVEEILAAQQTDVPLFPGDIVYVDATGLAEWNRVLQQLLPTLQTLLTTRYLLEGTPRPLLDYVD